MKREGQAVLEGRFISPFFLPDWAKGCESNACANCLIRQKIASAIDVQTRPSATCRLLPSPAPVPVHAKDESLGFELAFALDELV